MKNFLFRVIRSKHMYKQIELTTTTLDLAIKDFKYQSYFLKIDVQGNELEVLKGGIAVLSQALSVLIEVMPSNARQVEIHEILTSCGLELSNTIGSNSRNRIYTRARTN